ncbi:protein Shroom2 [Trichinella spiralis]|uniref:protein Shroom2 n=1 Tax=Trichinella spiralis TaxID=6334 RepID=UPI0001EFC670|nr:protein Shroom2 [Trichinella spiralis]
MNEPPPLGRGPALVVRGPETLTDPRAHPFVSQAQSFVEKSDLGREYVPLLTIQPRKLSLIAFEEFDLISRLSRKLKVLKEEKRVIEEEIKTNESMGTELLAVIAALDNVSIAQKEKVAIYVEDVDKITRLLLKLASQFRRVGRILSRAGDSDSNNDEEMLAAKKRHAVLLEQLEDAKELKEDLHRRGSQLAKFLTQMLSEEQLVDYQYFIRMKSKLLAETQEIEEKILLGEEQKEVLERS